MCQPNVGGFIVRMDTFHNTPIRMAFLMTHAVSLKEHSCLHFMLECGYAIIADCGINVVRTRPLGTMMI
ncbi:MAG: hypothetical protein GFH27_549297n310 [Chloroflexi bacterium AL-W]|nr:hypothetical protein [Chloroflexi bacterium AL-N1]NOK68837.1 hypothetical protein [Chloroflexi bacterium AL-N10]NOK76821.1 hypothetical protein [Chloroflexi bacterium AL-N5]NOK82792.1 hypothetical protein [Chloroflexi bacterium AL-W]NOK90678.1 hypothetical protein [Chloroflexi bacterium AL-N15]